MSERDKATLSAGTRTGADAPVPGVAAAVAPLRITVLGSLMKDWKPPKVRAPVGAS